MEKRITFKDLVMQVNKDQVLTYLIDNMCSFDNDVSSKDIYEKLAAMTPEEREEYLKQVEERARKRKL